MQILNGFVKIHRKLIQWGWYQDYVIKDVFIHLLLTANYKESQWNGRCIKDGQVITSYRRLSEDLGFTVEQVRRALLKLRSTGEITIETTNKYSIVTVVNWGDYQFNDYGTTSNTTSNLTSEIPGKQQTNNKQTTHKPEFLPIIKKNKRIKEYKKENKKEKADIGKIPEGFSSAAEYEAHIAMLRR